MIAVVRFAWIAIPVLAGCPAPSVDTAQSSGPRAAIAAANREQAGPPPKFSILELSDTGLLRHEIDFGEGGIRSGDFEARTFGALNPDQAWEDTLFELVPSNMDGTYSDLARSFARTASVRAQSARVSITLSRPSKFFQKNHFRAFYQLHNRRDRATGQSAPVPLAERPASWWTHYMTEPRPQAGGWYPMRDIDKEVSLSLTAPFGATWKRDSIESKYFTRSLLKPSPVTPSSSSKPRATVPVIKDMTINYMPSNPRAWIVVFFQPTTSQKLKAFAQKHQYGLSTVAAAGSKYSRHQAALIQLQVGLEQRNVINVPIVTVGFSAGGVTAMNATVWLPEYIAGAVVDGHTDLAEVGEPWTLRSMKESRIALLTGRRDSISGWNKDAHRFGLLRGQPRFERTHAGGHSIAPIADYQAAIQWVLESPD